ncbi:hypothetical protein H0H93_010883 [Arthromyces matolae]|nr:hypothetical protein H0H93_010883 [Arthromyces matolae]
MWFSLVFIASATPLDRNKLVSHPAYGHPPASKHCVEANLGSRNLDYGHLKILQPTGGMLLHDLKPKPHYEKSYLEEIELWPKEIQDCFRLIDSAESTEDLLHNTYSLLTLQWEHLAQKNYESSQLIHHTHTCRYAKEIYRAHILVEFDVSSFAWGFDGHNNAIVSKLHQVLQNLAITYPWIYYRNLAPPSDAKSQKKVHDKDVRDLADQIAHICIDKVSRCTALIEWKPENIGDVAKACSDVEGKVLRFIKEREDYAAVEGPFHDTMEKLKDEVNILEITIKSERGGYKVPIEKNNIPELPADFYPEPGFLSRICYAAWCTITGQTAQKKKRA